MRKRHFAALLAALLMMAACSSPESATSDEGSTTSQEPVVEAAVEPTSSTSEPTTTTPPPVSVDAPGFEVLREQDVEYLVDDEGSWTMDVFYPSEPGDWPLVVVYHGMTTQRAVTAAKTIAASGAVAVAPQWLNTTSLTREEYIDGALFDRAACATAVAQQVAGDFGADPTRTTIAGFSAGVHPAGWVGLGVVRDDVCDQSIAHHPVGLVMGDSQLIFYEQGWDADFADPSSNAEDTTDRFVNPERWDLPDDVSVYLWSTDFAYGRTVENPPDDDAWIWARDTTGTLVEDFESLGAIESEWIGFVENGQLLELRMDEAGIDVAHDAVGGGHTYSAVVYEGIDALIHQELVTGATAENGHEWPSQDALEAAAAFVCEDFDAIGSALADQANLVEVDEQSWDTDTNEIIRGREAVLAAFEGQDIASVECGDDVVSQADYIAFPVSTTYGDGTGDQEIWALKVGAAGAITWINRYASALGVAAPPSGTDPALVAEARAFCGTLEGKGFTRDADEFLAFMTDDPSAQAIPNGYHAAGDEGVRNMIEWYPPTDRITCEEGGISNGVWSATGTTLTNLKYTIFNEGITVHHHTPDGIKDLYYLWTNAAMPPDWEAGTWGMPPSP